MGMFSCCQWCRSDYCDGECMLDPLRERIEMLEAKVQALQKVIDNVSADLALQDTMVDYWRNRAMYR